MKKLLLIPLLMLACSPDSPKADFNGVYKYIPTDEPLSPKSNVLFTLSHKGDVLNATVQDSAAVYSLELSAYANDRYGSQKDGVDLRIYKNEGKTWAFYVTNEGRRGFVSELQKVK